MLFAVMTVTQVPAMAMACATKSQSVILAAAHVSHYAHSGDHQHHSDVAADNVADDVLNADAAHHASVCQAMGCCMALDPGVIRAPIAIDLLIGLIGPAPARVMLPALPEPADPPPRRQV